MKVLSNYKMEVGEFSRRAPILRKEAQQREPGVMGFVSFFFIFIYYQSFSVTKLTP